MSIRHRTEPIVAGDDEIRAALDDAHVPSLLPTLAQLTGDRSLLRPEFRPDPDNLLDPQGGLGPDQLAAARDLALEVLTALRDTGPPEIAEPDPGTLKELMEFATGGVAMDDYLEMLRDELGEVDHRTPTWSKDDLAPDREFRAVVVGAGMSGIAAAHRLQQAGVPYAVFEKNHDVGGTWLENTYPGCRVDVPNHVYSYSFAQHIDWPHHFSTQDVLLDYFRSCADEFGIRDHIRFGTEVCATTFDEAAGEWSITVRNPDGAAEVVRANAVISAVGQLNRPKMPAIAGIDRFGGVSFHSARWDHDVELAGARVAVIGTGASAAQFVPIIAAQVEHLAVFQRTPAWLAPTPEYHNEVPDGLRWLFTHVPVYAQWYRFWLFWRGAEGMLPAVRVDPDWDGGDHAVSALNDQLRQLLAAYIEIQYPDRPDLVDHVVPGYPPGAKRIVRDNGIWASTLQRANVDLVTGDVDRIVEDGIVTADGTTHPADVIIYATGFHASRFLTPMRVTGRGGADLHEQWDGDARAHLGVVVPRFPNFFILYGPNTNIVVNGSIIYFSECEVHYTLECIRALLAGGHSWIDVRPDVHEAYNRRIDAGNLEMAWGVSDVNSWYKSDSGRVAQNWPFSLLEYWEQTRAVDLADYDVS